MPSLLLPCVSLVSLLSVFLLVDAHPWAAKDLPNPQNDPHNICGRNSLKSAVCDPDGNISPADADQIDGLINFINEGSHGFNKLPCPGGETAGAQIAVVVIQRMAKPMLSFQSSQQQAYQFAKDIHDSWGVGDAQCQNGIVLMFSIADHAMGFSTGAGVKHIFSDSMVTQVMNRIKPKLKQRLYGPAIIDAVTMIGNILSAKPEYHQSQGSFMSFILFPFMLFGCCCSCIAGSVSKSKYEQCKDLLSKMDKDRASANRCEYVATSCPICLEDFTSDDDATNTEQEAETSKSSPVSDFIPSDSQVKPSTVDSSSEALLSDQSKSEEGEGEQQDQTRVLVCGHKFHERCILSWMSQSSAEGNALCPICRKPIVSGEEIPQDQPSGWDVYEPEYDFRLRRMHQYYPDYITLNMINTWQNDRHSPHPMTTNPAFVAVDPQVVAEAARSSGGGGSSFSFGGGSSSGGGGGGGGW